MPSDDSQRSESYLTTASHLERLTLICVAAINQRDWTYSTPEASEFLSHVDVANFTAQFDSYPRVMNWQQQNEAWQTMFSDYPEGQFNVTRMSTSVDEERGMASVMMESEVPGIGNVTLHGLSEAKWRKMGGKWFFYHTVGMRGTGGNTGFVG